MKKWVCEESCPRARKAAWRIGFRWDGVDFIMESETRPPRPWGCKVRPYRPPAMPRKGFGVVAGILLGTHDEFGRPYKQKDSPPPSSEQE